VRWTGIGHWYGYKMKLDGPAWETGTLVHGPAALRMVFLRRGIGCVVL